MQPAATTPDTARRRPNAVVIAAGAWSGVVALLGAAWSAGAPGFPFGANDPRAGEAGSLFAAAEPVPGGAAIAVLGAIGVAAAAGLRRWPDSRWLAALAAALAAVLLVAVPDLRVIQNFLYLFFGYTGL